MSYMVEGKVDEILQNTYFKVAIRGDTTAFKTEEKLKREE